MLNRGERSTIAFYEIDKNYVIFLNVGVVIGSIIIEPLFIGGLMVMHRLTALLKAVLANWGVNADEEKAQGLVEYALILMFVAMAVIVILVLLGPTIGNVFSNVIVFL